MSARKLGIKANVSTSTVTRFAKGGRPSLQTLSYLAAQFGKEKELGDIITFLRQEARDSLS